jgi:hypothetical protein
MSQNPWGGFGAQIRGTEGMEGELLAAVEEGTQAGLEALGIKGAEMVQANIATPYNGKPAAVCFGILAGSVVSNFTREAGMFKEIVGIAPVLGADRYAAPVETGARPHMPPASELLPWVQKKFGIADEKQALSMAFAIAITIRKKGTQGHQMFSRALTEIEPLCAPALEAHIARACLAHGFTLAGDAS